MLPASGLLARYLESMRSTNYASSTIYTRAGTIVRFRRITGLDPLEASEDQVIGWWTSLTTTPHARAVDLSNVRAYCRWAVRHGHIAVDPTRLIDRPRVGRRYPRPIAELAFGKALATAPADVRAILCLAGYGGLRACEISKLEWGDIHDGIILIHGKGSKERVVPAHPAITEALANLPGSKKRGHVFVYRADYLQGGVRPHLICQWANLHLHENGIPETLHQLRHRFGTQLYQATRDIRLCQDLLGHASVDTTALYTAWDKTEAAVGISRLPVPA